MLLARQKEVHRTALLVSKNCDQECWTGRQVQLCQTDPRSQSYVSSKLRRKKSQVLCFVFVSMLARTTTCAVLDASLWNILILVGYKHVSMLIEQHIRGIGSRLTRAQK
jgi:hypothetical protein